ncbi:hypothetical protein Tco_0237377 [Tanacetum coccineum]
MLRVFPISLTRAASRWLRNEPTGSIKTWEDLKTKFLNKYCPHGRTAKKMEEINNFQQEPDETLYQAWECYKELLMKCPQHYLTEMHETAADAKKAIQEMAEYSQKWHNGTSRGRSTETSDGLAAIQAQLNNLGREIKKLIHTRYAVLDLPNTPYPLDRTVHSSYSKASQIDESIPQKEKDPGCFTLPCFINSVCFDNALVELGASVSVMPLLTYLNLGLGELAHTKLTVELADRIVKYPKGIAENILVRICKFTFLVDFIILDMPEDVKVPLILGRLFLTTAHAKINVYKRKITLRVGEEKIIFKSVKPASSLIKRVYMLSLRERMELDLEARLMGETLVLNRSLDPFLEDYIELNDLNEPFELRRNQGDDLMPTIEEGEVIEEFRTRDEDLDTRIDDYPSYCDDDKKIHIDCAHNLKFSCMIGFEFTHVNFFPLLYVNVMSKKFHNSIMKDKMLYKGDNVVGALMNVPIFVGTFYVVTDFTVLKDMDAYRDEGMGDVIVGEPFLREVGIKARRFDGMFTIYNGDDEVTYQMVRSHPRFKHHTNEQCNKIPPLLKDSTLSEFYQWKNGSHAGTLACMIWNGEEKLKTRPRERISTNIGGEFTNLEDLEVLDCLVGVEEVKESGLESMEDVTFDQIMDETDQKNKAAENPKSRFDTESKIKIIKRFPPSQPDDDAQITFLGAEPYNQTKTKDGDSDSRLCCMPDDDMVSLTGFGTPDSADDDSKEGTGEMFYAFTDMPAQSDPLGHLHEELCILNNKIDQLESNITKKVTDDIQSFVPSIVANSLKENMPGLLSKALKNTLPQLIKDSIKQSVSESIKEKLPVCTAQLQQSLQDQLLKILLRNKEFNAFNTLENRMFVTLQQELGKVIKTKLGVSVKNKVHKGMKMVYDKLASVQSTVATNSQHVQYLRRDVTIANAQGEQPPTEELSNEEQSPVVNEENALVLHNSVEKSSEKNVSDDEPPPEVTKMTLKQFTEHLTKTTSSIFSLAPPREPTLRRDPTPLKDKSKRKGIATEEPLKEIMPYMEEGGLVTKIPSLKSFVIPEGKLINEDIMAQVKEIKRLADLKAEKEKSKKSLQKIMNPATIRAQAQKMANYRVNSSKEATIRITRGNDPLYITIHDKFILKTLEFSKWLEWVLSQAKALSIPPPPELSTFRVSINDRKRKRSSEILQEVFVKENVVVDGMHKNIIPPPGVEGRNGLVIREPKSGIFYYNGNFDLAFQREEEFHLATTSQLIRLHDAIQRGTPEAEEMFKKIGLTIEARDDVDQARKIVQDNLDGLGPRLSNLRRIQVKDIVKEVKDHLNTYSSAGMDISWYVVGIRCSSKESQRWQYSDYPITL